MTNGAKKVAEVAPGEWVETRPEGKKRVGFAGMDREQQRAIASKGGQSVRAEDRMFKRDPELASKAGRKGGQASRGGGRRSPKDPASEP